MVTHYRDYESFKRVAVPFLEQRSEVHQLPLGILERGDTPLLMAIAEEDDRKIIILQTIEEQAILAGEAFSDPSMRKLARILDCKGYVGEHALVKPLLAPHTKYRVKMDQGMYALHHVTRPPQLEYAFRIVDEQAVDQAVSFGWDFICETGALAVTERNRLQNEQTIRRHSSKQTLFGLFDGDRLIAMASASRPTASGVTVSYVYTPPELRGQGLASDLVARVCTYLLEQAYPMITLYTDWSNRTSNKIYQAIGFQLVGRSLQITKTDKYR